MSKKILILLLSISLILGGAYLKINKSIESARTPIDNIVKDIEDNIDREELEAPQELSVKSINILGVGDIMFHMPQITSAKLEDGSYDFIPPFKYVRKYIEEADIALGNFESVTAGDERRFNGFPRFNSPIETISALKTVGFDVLSTANNHSLDGGKNGILKTIENIENHNLKSIGTYKDKNRTLLTEGIEDIKIGFLSYTYGLNGLDSLLTSDELSYMVDRIDEEKIQQDIKYLKNKNVDLIAIYIHWGNEYQKKPHIYQEALGKKMIEWGANIIFGSHPHVIQRYEIIEYGGKKNYIIYSMGNFLSNQGLDTMGNSFTEDGVIVRLNIEKNLLNNEVEIKNIDHIPTWVYKYKEGNQFKYYILPLDSFGTIPDDLELSNETVERMKKSYNDTMSTLEDN